MGGNYLIWFPSPRPNSTLTQKIIHIPLIPNQALTNFCTPSLSWNHSCAIFWHVSVCVWGGGITIQTSKILSITNSRLLFITNERTNERTVDNSSKKNTINMGPPNSTKHGLPLPSPPYYPLPINKPIKQSLTSIIIYLGMIF